jgi:hypothetical protein
LLESLLNVKKRYGSNKKTKLILILVNITLIKSYGCCLPTQISERYRRKGHLETGCPRWCRAPDRELHLITLNRYRYAEQRSCKDLTEIIEQLDGQPPELVRDLSHHISDEARHAMWLTFGSYQLSVSQRPLEGLPPSATGEPEGLSVTSYCSLLIGTSPYF